MGTKRGLWAACAAVWFGAAASLVGVSAYADQPATAPAAASASAPNETRAAFLKLLDRPRVDAKPDVQPLLTIDGTKKAHLWFSSEAHERVPGYLQFPDAKQFKGRRPVVIALHGTGGVKERGEVGD